VSAEIKRNVHVNLKNVDFNNYSPKNRLHVFGKNKWGNIIWALKQIKHGKLKILFGRLNNFFGL